MEDQTFARNSLLQRLDDDDDSVVEEVLKGGKALLQIIGEDAIIESFEKKMKYGKSYDRYFIAFKYGYFRHIYDHVIKV